MRVGRHQRSDEEPVAIVVPRGELDVEALGAFVRRQERGLRPAFVRVVDDIPMTDGFRPRKSGFRADPLGGEGATLYRWDDAEGRYEPA